MLGRSKPATVARIDDVTPERLAFESMLAREKQLGVELADAREKAKRLPEDRIRAEHELDDARKAHEPVARNVGSLTVDEIIERARGSGDSEERLRLAASASRIEEAERRCSVAKQVEEDVGYRIDEMDQAWRLATSEATYASGKMISTDPGVIRLAQDYVELGRKYHLIRRFLVHYFPDRADDPNAGAEYGVHKLSGTIPDCPFAPAIMAMRKDPAARLPTSDEAFSYLRDNPA